MLRGPTRGRSGPALAGLLALALGAACGHREERSDPPAEPPPEAAARERLLTALRRAQDRVATFQASARAQVRNAESHREALQKAERVHEGLRFERLVPPEPGLPELERALRAAARKAGLKVVSFAAALEEEPPPPVPEQLVTPATPRYEPEQLRQRIELRLEVRPPDIQRLQRLWEALRAEPGGRLVVVRAIDTGRRSALVHAEAFRSLPTRPPRYVVRPPTLEEVLPAEAREALERLEGDPQVAKELGALRAALAEARKDAEAAERALRPLPRADLLVARTEWLSRLARAEAKRRFEDVLRRPAP